MVGSNSSLYNDKWDTDPNDPELGSIVTLEDGSRHTKWIKFMYPRIQMMYSMLKPNGILAICIDERELFHLGMKFTICVKYAMKYLEKKIGLD